MKVYKKWLDNFFDQPLPSAEVVAEYDADFLMQCQGVLYWDQFCDLREQMNGERGRTYNFPLVASSNPAMTEFIPPPRFPNCATVFLFCCA